ncbi:MAG: hypothetical protein V3V29_09010 [Acidimicrobiia bacterium]
MRRLTSIAALAAVIAGGCTSANEAETLSLAEELAAIAADANEAVAALEHFLAQPYDNRAQLYTRLVDLRLPTTFAILIDKAQRVVPPPGTEAELDRYVVFLTDLLVTSQHLDGSIAAEDLTAIAIAAVQFDAAMGALAAVLPASSCPALVPASSRDLCSPGDLNGYEARLGFELRKFIASFRPAFRVPDTFGDVVRGRVLATLQGDAALVLENTANRLGDLDPGTAYVRLHQILLDYFPGATAAWAEFDVDPDTDDPLIYRLIVDSLEAERVTTQALLEAEHELIQSALPGSQIVSITDMWFAAPAEARSEE